MSTPRYSSWIAYGTLAVVLLASSALVAHATSKKDIAYPIRELGNCRDEAACQQYCDARGDLERARACIAVAKRHNLLPPDELEEAERYVVRLGIAEGPGGCRSENECATYCEDVRRLNECLDFAQKHGLRSQEEIAEGRKIAEVLAQGGVLPGGCRTKNECMAYCEDPSHMKECVAFAEQAGFISAEEAAEAKKIIPLLERGEKTPGNCGRKEACEAYCMEPAHLDECLAFAEKAGLIAPEELADAKKFAPFIKSGQTPGGCKRKAECETYCNDVAHFDECVAFAERAGIISPEEVALAKKFKGKGPGGCTSRESCEEFCRAPANQEACIVFAKEHGLTDEIAEIEAKVRSEVEAKMMACRGKPCGDFIACLQSLRPSGPEGEGADEAGALPGDIQAELNSCIKEIEAQAIQDATGSRGEHPIRRETREPLEGAGGSPSQSSDTEFQKRYEEEYQKRYEQEYQKQYEEQVKSQVNCALFAAAPNCSYVGSPDSDNYKYCKQCFPEK